MTSDFKSSVFVCGQCAVGADGRSPRPRNMEKQVQTALDNVETVLAEARLSLPNIVRMNTYVRDKEAFLEQAAEPMSERLVGHHAPQALWRASWSWAVKTCR